MKKGLIIISIVMSLFMLSNCDGSLTKSKKEKSDATSYVLCEGNFTKSEASLWQYDNEEVTGPVYWNANTNPLGDVGQSLCYSDEKLFIVVNNSHTIEVLDTETNENIATIVLPFAGPRFFTTNKNIGYVSCWNLNGIVSIDLDNFTILDTIFVGALPEDIIIKDDILYTSIPMNSAWGSENKVYAYDLSMATPIAIDTFEVISGPGKMILEDDELWVASTYYDAAWQTYAGMSKININTKNVTTKDFGVTFSFGKDIIDFDNSIYRSFNNSLVKINNDLSFDESNIIGTLPGKVYSVATDNDKIYCGITDYVAPDTVFVMDSEGEILETLKVGAIPTAITFIKD